MTVNHLYPTTRPTLDLNFARQKRLDPRVTFTRGSTATYVGDDGLIKTAASNEARFDHDPATGESLGLLMETSRTNLAENSEDFSLWTAQNSTVLTAQGTAPDGTNTAFKIQEDTSTISHSIREPSNSTWSGAATLSCYVKPAGRNFAYMGFTGVSQTSITFDLTNKVSSYKGTNVTSGSVEDAGNGWLRIVAVFSSSITSGRATVGPAESDSSSGLNYTGDGSSGILAWGAQLEVSPFPTSYIPTSGSTVTRATDLADMTGTNFSSWYNQSEGSFHVNAKPNYNYQQYIFRARLNNSIGVAVYLGGNDARSSLYVTGGSGTVNLNLASNIQNFAAGYKDYDFAVAGPSQILTNTAQTLPPYSLTSAEIGNLGGGQNLNGHIARIAYYPTRLTDSQLQELTR